MRLSAVILAKTDTDGAYNMTLHCIRTLADSEKDVEIIVVESNKAIQTAYRYPDNVRLVIPDGDFNFHKFLNIGIRQSSGEYIALLNNDLVFDKHWFEAILEVAVANPKILSFSPVGHASEIKHGKDFEVGYKVRTHVKGWCIVAKKAVFKTAGLLDETFDFYFADNDYAMTLRFHNIKHALVYGSRVEHLEKRSTPQKSALPDQAFQAKYTIPDYLRHPRYQWVLSSEKNLSGFLKFHGKWGNPDWLYKKNRLADILTRYGLGFAVKIFFKL